MVAAFLGAVPRELTEEGEDLNSFTFVCFLAGCACIFLCAVCCRPRSLRVILGCLSGCNLADWQYVFLTCSKPSKPRTPQPPASRPEVEPPPPCFSSRKPVILSQIRRSLASSQSSSESVEPLSPVQSAVPRSHRNCMGPRSAASSPSGASWLPTLIARAQSATPRSHRLSMGLQSAASSPSGASWSPTRTTRCNPSHTTLIAWPTRHQDEQAPLPPDLVGKVNVVQAAPRLLGRERALEINATKSDKTSQFRRSERSKSTPNPSKDSTRRSKVSQVSPSPTTPSPRPAKASPRFPQVSPSKSHAPPRPKKVVTFGSVRTRKLYVL